MCVFLTIGVERARAAAVEAALRAARFELGSDVNPGVARLFPSGSWLVGVTVGGCSCELTPERADFRAEADARRLAKFRRRGYSAARIARIFAEPPRPPPARPHCDALRSIGPMLAYWHVVRGDPFTEAVPPDARATRLFGA